MPPTDWSVEEGSSIRDFGVTAQLLEFTYLPHDRQERVNVASILPRDLVNMYLADDLNVSITP